MPSFFRGLLFQFSKESFRYTCPICIELLLLVPIVQPEESHIYLLDDPRYHQVVEECDRCGNLANATVKLQDKLGLPFEAITIQHIHSKQFRSLEVDIHDVRTVSALVEGLPRSLYGKEPPVPWYHMTVFVVFAKVVFVYIESSLAKCLPTYFTTQEQHGGWDKYELKITSHLREARYSLVLLDWLANVSLLKNLVSLDLSGLVCKATFTFHPHLPLPRDDDRRHAEKAVNLRHRDHVLCTKKKSKPVYLTTVGSI
ncbi:hypothetical protein CYMTET_10745 [Cymbomonas tetramitiformis]|uniref:Uncharacterized protein n=1 Tax=Cymbomonas tetramitiformis TaxID=36881 RepID=A0AAE0LDV1_9CHLO|nr:hypothetical protein CYMTET_10745 [Cymbomonas tetramitiformis]